MVAVLRSKSLIRDAWIAQRIIPNYEAIAAQARTEAVVCIHCGELVHPSNLSKHMTLYHSQNTPISTQTAPTRNFRNAHMLIAIERLERTETGSRVVYDVNPMTRKQRDVPGWVRQMESTIRFLNNNKTEDTTSAS